MRQGCSCSAIEAATVLTVENSINFYVKPIVGYSSRVEISNINGAFGDRRVTWAPILLYLNSVGVLSCRVTFTSTMRFLFPFLVKILNILFHFTFASPFFISVVWIISLAYVKLCLITFFKFNQNRFWAWFFSSETRNQIAWKLLKV